MTRTWAGALVGCGLALTLVGCGLASDGAAAEPDAAAEPSTEETAETGGVLENLRDAVDGTRTVESYRAVMTGNSAGEDVEMELAYTSSPEPTVEMTMSTAAGGMVFLVRGEETLMGDSARGTWLRVDTGGQTQDLGQFRDPSAELDKLMAAGDARQEGTEEIRGVTTTRYSGVYDVEDALAELGEQERADARRAYEAQGITEVPFTVWIGDDGLLRRIRYDQGSTSMTMDFLDFDEDVVIDYPAEDQITDMGDVPAELEGMGG